MVVHPLHLVILLVIAIGGAMSLLVSCTGNGFRPEDTYGDVDVFRTRLIRVALPHAPPRGSVLLNEIIPRWYGLPWPHGKHEEHPR